MGRREWAGRGASAGPAWVFCVSTRNVAVEADLYAVPADSGPDDALEVAFSEIETLLPGYLADLRDGPTPRKGSRARNEIGELLALQMVRTREHIGRWTFPLAAAEFTGERPVSREGIHQFLTEEYLGEVPSEQEVQGAFDFANYMLSKGMPDKRDILSMMLRVAGEELAPRIAVMAWAVEMSSGPVFVTTDRPIAMWRRRTQDGNTRRGARQLRRGSFPTRPAPSARAPPPVPGTPHLHHAQPGRPGKPAPSRRMLRDGHRPSARSRGSGTAQIAACSPRPQVRH